MPEMRPCAAAPPTRAVTLAATLMLTWGAQTLPAWAAPSPQAAPNPAPDPARRTASAPKEARATPPEASPDGEEVIDDPEDGLLPQTRAAPHRDAAEGDEVIDDPEDPARTGRPRPAPRAAPGRDAARGAPRDPGSGATPRAPFVPRAQVGGLLQLVAAFDLLHEGRRRGDESDLRPSEDVFELTLRARLFAEARFLPHVKVRLEARLDYGVTSERPKAGSVYWLGNGQAWETRSDVELGEAYVDLTYGPVDLRLGNQVLSWGLSELMNPNDVVNPLDLRRGILGFDEDRRLPVLAAKVAWHFRSLKLEGVWLPLFRPHRFELWGSDFALLGPGASSVLGQAEDRLDRLVHPTHRGRVSALLSATHPPPDDPSASSLGLRFSGRRRGWDFGLQYFFGWDRTPGVRVDSDFYRALMDGELFQNGTLNLVALGALLVGNPLFQARYHHGHQTGLSVGKAFEDFALKLDVSYFPDRGFLRTDRVPEPLAAGLIDLRVEHHTLVTALSAEYAYGSKVMVQVQGLHAALLDRKADDPRELMGFLTERQLALVLALVRVQLLRETLLLTLAGAVDLLHGSFVLGPTVAYKVTDSWRVSLGALWFEGKSNAPFGGWNKNDLIWLEVSWRF